VKRILIPIGLYTKPFPYTFLKEIFREPGKVEIVLFTVITLPPTTSLEQNDVVKLPIVEDHKRKLDEVSSFFREMGFEVIEKLVFARDVVEAILNEVLENPYDLLVLVKRKNLPRFIGRSISRALLPKVHKPILILTMD